MCDEIWRDDGRHAEDSIKPGASTAFLTMRTGRRGRGGHLLGDDVEDLAEVGLQGLGPVHVLDGGLDGPQVSEVVQVVGPGQPLEVANLVLGIVGAVPSAMPAGLLVQFCII